MSYNLFLDDYRFPNNCIKYFPKSEYINKEWIIVRNYYAFIDIIQRKGMPKLVSFDHDLADIHYKNQIFDYNDDNYEKTGYHCAKWLIEYCIDNNIEIPEVMIHSMNPYGTENIKSLFITYCKLNNIDYHPIPTVVKLN